MFQLLYWIDPLSLLSRPLLRKASALLLMPSFWGLRSNIVFNASVAVMWSALLVQSSALP